MVDLKPKSGKLGIKQKKILRNEHRDKPWSCGVPTLPTEPLHHPVKHVLSLFLNIAMLSNVR